MPSGAAPWSRSASAWRTAEKFWSRSAGTSVRLWPAGGWAGRPRATRAWVTLSSAWVTCARATSRAAFFWSNSSVLVTFFASSSLARSNSVCASAAVALLCSQVAARARMSATWLSTSSMARTSLKRWPRACATAPRTLALATTRSACAASTAACRMAACTRYGSGSSSTSTSPFWTRLLSSTSTRATWPTTRGATKVT